MKVGMLRGFGKFLFEIGSLDASNEGYLRLLIYDKDYFARHY